MATNNTGPSCSPISPGHSSILDMFLPGFTRVSPIIQHYTGIDLDVIIPYLCFFGLLLFLYEHACQWLQNMLMRYYTSTISVPCTDEAHGMLLAWLSAQPFFKNINSCLVRVDLKKSTSNGSNTKHLRYEPWGCEFWFRYKGHLVAFKRVEKRTNGSLFDDQTEDVSIRCYGWSTSILEAMMNESREKYLENLRGKTLVFEEKDKKWARSKTRSNRDVSTVLHDAESKAALFDDIGSFLDPTTREWYADKGIPYRRGYLLHGPPGTGKSSLSFSIAGRFGLDLYVLNIGKVTDETLASLMADLPQGCVLLLEDIDAVIPSRNKIESEEPKAASSDSKKIPSAFVTLSGLLNALDGVTSQEGQVLIMTTNYIEHLDDALIRPGRVDKKVKFRLPNRDLLEQLFRFVFTGSDDVETVDRLATEFADKIPESEFSYAEVLSLLLEHRMHPADAVAGVEAWVERIRDEKRGLRREGSWLHYA